MRLIVSQTPSNTPSNTPSYTPTGTLCPTLTPSLTSTATQTQTPSPTGTYLPTPTQTQTQTNTPSATFCFEPQAYVLFDAYSNRVTMNGWMASQGSSFRGMFLNSPSTNPSIFPSQMNAYIDYSGYTSTGFDLSPTPITMPNEDPFTLTSSVTFSGENVWVNFLMPTCPTCPEGIYGLMGYTGPTALTNPVYRSIPFYYSGTTIDKGYYRLYTTYGNTDMRLNSSSYEYFLGSLVCLPTPTPTATATPTTTPTSTSTSTPTQTPTSTQTGTPPVTPSNTPSNTATQTQTKTPTATPTTTTTLTATPTQTQTGTPTGTRPVSTPTPTATPTATCACLYYSVNPPTISGEKISVVYVDCYGDSQSIDIFWTSGSQLICAISYEIIDYGINGSVSPFGGSCCGDYPPLTPTATSTIGSTPTPTPTHSVLELRIETNASLDIVISTISVNALLPSVIGGTLPNTTGNGTDLAYALSPGTYDVIVYYSTGVAGQRIAINSPTTGYECQNTGAPGSAAITFTGVGFDGLTPVVVFAEDGAC